MCRLSYKGAGEPLCFVAFGPLAVGAAFLCHALPYVAATSAMDLLMEHLFVVMSAATVVGLTTTSILFCSHFHQIKGDIAAGKQSPLTRLGTARACQVMHHRTSADLHEPA
jgi:2-carboxy-1,4-naphthoquinone phytyltransferase